MQQLNQLYSKALVNLQTAHTEAVVKNEVLLTDHRELLESHNEESQKMKSKTAKPVLPIREFDREEARQTRKFPRKLCQKIASPNFHVT